jgi:small subunit ribosomal protein S5
MDKKNNSNNVAFGDNRVSDADKARSDNNARVNDATRARVNDGRSNDASRARVNDASRAKANDVKDGERSAARPKRGPMGRSKDFAKPVIPTNIKQDLLGRKVVFTVKPSGKVRKTFVVVCVVRDDGGLKRSIGVGSSSAKHIADARNQAAKSAQKNFISFKLNKNGTLYHDIKGTFHGTDVSIYHTREGIKACPTAKRMFELLGLKATCKVTSGSKNKLNIAYAVIDALSKHEGLYDIAARCGQTIDQILERKMCVREVANG